MTRKKTVYMCFDARLLDGSKFKRSYHLFSLKSGDLLSQKKLAPKLNLNATYSQDGFYGLMGCGLMDKKILLVGGFTEGQGYDEDSHTNIVVEFDTADKLCTSFKRSGGSSMLGCKVEAFVRQSSDGKLYVLGGRNVRFSSAPFEVLDTQGVWKKLPEPLYSQEYCCPSTFFEFNSFNYVYLRNYIVLCADGTPTYAYDMELNSWSLCFMFGVFKPLPFKGMAVAIEDFDPVNPILISFSGGLLYAHLLRYRHLSYEPPKNMKTELLAKDLTPSNYNYASFVILGKGILCLVTTPDGYYNYGSHGDGDIYVITFRVVVKTNHADGTAWYGSPVWPPSLLQVEENGFLRFELLSKYNYDPSRLTSKGLKKISRCIGCFAP